jgi:Ca2+-binding RTX toxin-like protein
VDVLRGGLGADVFRFGASHSGAPGQVRDRIADFSHGEGDRIDLAAIDANPSLPGEQAFAFIGAGAFTQAGQVRAVVVNGLTSVSGQLDAPGSAADFSIVLNGAVALAAADFIL